MCNAISILLVGRITDKFGKRHVSIVAGVWVIVGAAVAGTAKSMNTLIGANVSKMFAYRWQRPRQTDNSADCR